MRAPTACAGSAQPGSQCTLQAICRLHTAHVLLVVLRLVLVPRLRGACACVDTGTLLLPLGS